LIGLPRVAGCSASGTNDIHLLAKRDPPGLRYRVKVISIHTAIDLKVPDPIQAWLISGNSNAIGNDKAFVLSIREWKAACTRSNRNLFCLRQPCM
jgi:hypothetical protein